MGIHLARFGRFGLAMYYAEVLEHGMVNAFIVALILPTARNYTDSTAWEEAFDRAFDMQLAKTFGRMLDALKPLGLSDDIAGRLRSAKVDRDRLAHRFFREHDKSFLSRGGRTRMIAECEDAVCTVLVIP